MGQIIESNGEFFRFVKREFGERVFSEDELELMFISFVAGKYGVKPQVPELFKKGNET